MVTLDGLLTAVLSLSPPQFLLILRTWLSYGVVRLHTGTGSCSAAQPLLLSLSLPQPIRRAVSLNHRRPASLLIAFTWHRKEKPYTTSQSTSNQRLNLNDDECLVAGAGNTNIYSVELAVRKCSRLTPRWLDKRTLINPATYYPFSRRSQLHTVFFFFISALSTTFLNVKDKTWHQSGRFANNYPPFCQFWLIFTHLKLWIASARQNFRWVAIPI